MEPEISLAIRVIRVIRGNSYPETAVAALAVFARLLECVGADEGRL